MNPYELMQACGDERNPPDLSKLEEILGTGTERFIPRTKGVYRRSRLLDVVSPKGRQTVTISDYLLFDEFGTSFYSLLENEAVKFEKRINDSQRNHSKPPTALGAVLSTITGSLSFYLLDLYLFDTTPEIIQALFVDVGAVIGIFMQSLYTANPMLWRQNSIYQAINLPPNVRIHDSDKRYDPDLVAYAITKDKRYLGVKPDDPIEAKEAKPNPKTWIG